MLPSLPRQPSPLQRACLHVWGLLLMGPGRGGVWHGAGVLVPLVCYPCWTRALLQARTAQQLAAPLGSIPCFLRQVWNWCDPAVAVKGACFDQDTDLTRETVSLNASQCECQ